MQKDIILLLTDVIHMPKVNAPKLVGALHMQKDVILRLVGIILTQKVS